VLYAGNIGEGQGLHRIIPELAKKLEGRAVFRLIGDGERKMLLEQRLVESDCRNVELCSMEGAVKVFPNLELSRTRREGFIEKFSCESVMKSMATDIIPMLMTAFPDY